MNRIILAVLSVLVFASSVLAHSAPRTVGPLPDAAVYSWIDALPFKGEHRYDDFTARKVDRTCAHYCVRIQDGSERVTIEGGTYRHIGSPEKISGAFALVAGSLALRDVTAIGSRDERTVKTAYPNSDGVMGAARTKLVITGGYYARFWDGGIDSKADTSIDGAVAEGNGISYRCWSTWEVGTITSIDPVKGHLQTNVSPVAGCNLHARMLIAKARTSAAVLIGLAPNTRVVIDACRLELPADTRLFYYQSGASAKNTTVILGPTCVRGGKVVVYKPVKAAAGLPITQIVTSKTKLPDSNRDGLIRFATSAAKVSSPQPVGTVVKSAGGSAGAWLYEVVR